MRKLVRASLGALVLLAIPALLIAGAVGDWALPHRTVETVSKRITGASFRSLYSDSSVFALEGNASTKPDTATLYDAGFDTTDTFVLSDVWYPTAPGDTTGRTILGGTNLLVRPPAAVADSNYMFTLCVTPSGTIAVGDTLFVTFQYSFDGTTWIYENSMRSVPSRVRPILPQLTVAASGGTSRATNWVLSYFSQNLPSTTQGPSGYYGAFEGRFLLRLGASSAPQTVRAQVIKATTSPDKQPNF